MAFDRVRRSFVDIDHGQIHCRIAGDLSTGGTPPLLMLHGGPGSSAGLMPMIEALVRRGFRIIAPDLMGNGQSDPPPVEPDMEFYVDCILMLLDRLGVRQVDCYGHHAGAQIGCALAVGSTDRVRRLILDGVGLFSDDQRREFQDRYAPAVAPVASGEHLDRLWRFLSATTVRFPHYSEDSRDEIPGGAPRPPSVLTDEFADVVRNWRTYHLSYRASFADDFGKHLPLVNQSAVVLEVAGDPLARYAKVAAMLIGDASVMPVERATRADAIAQVLLAQTN